MRLSVYAAVLVTMAGAITLGELDDVLKARHPPGAPSYGIADLSGAPFGFNIDQVEQVVKDSWLLGAPPDFTNPERIVHAHVIVDCLFAAAYAWLLFLVARGLGRRLEDAADAANLQEAALHRLHERDIEPTDEAMDAQRYDFELLVRRYARFAYRASVAAPILFAVDVVENVLQSAAVENVDARWLYVLLFGATWAKFLLVAFIVVALVLGVIGLDILYPRAKNRLAATFIVARAPLILGVVLVVAFLTDLTPFGEQSSDVLLGWKQGVADAVVAFLLFAWLSVLVIVLARRLIEPTPRTAEAEERMMQAAPYIGYLEPQEARFPIRLLPLGIVGAALIALAFVLSQTDYGGAGIGVAGGILAGIALASRLVGKASSNPLPALGLGTVTLPALAAAVPLVVLGLALLKATVAEIAWASREEYVIWALAGLAIAAVGLVVFTFARSPAANTLALGFGWWLMGPTLGFLAYLVWRIWLHPWRVADALGAFGVFAAAAGAALLVAYLLMWPEERLRPPSVFAIVRLRRIPVFGLVFLWAVIAAILDPGGFHDVRTRAAEGPVRPYAHEQGLSVEQAFRRWQRGNTAPAAAGARRVRPLVFVVAAGGGVRAAYWTGLVLECIFGGRGAEACTAPKDRDPAESAVFAATGASGGSVGLANWIAHQRSDRGNWLDHLGDDSVTPTLAWALFADLPNAFVKFTWFGDRAQVLERTWEQQWGGRDTSLADLLLPWRTGPTSGGPLSEGLFAAAADATVPILLLTSTSVEDGCRFAVSPFDSNVGLQRVGTRIEDCLTMRSFEKGGGAHVKPVTRDGWALAATKDLDDYLCSNADVRLSTAAHLSARFPYVSPSGRLLKCEDGDDETDEQKTATYLVDGGYYDNTAASPVIELWAALEPYVARFNADNDTCVAPFVLEIDNHYGEPPGPEPEPRPKESQVPIQTLLGTRNAHEANSRQAAAVGASVPFADDLVVTRAGTGVEIDRFARIYPRAHPGTRAPLGWALSEASREDLWTELASDQNREEIRKARRWFRGDLVCSPAARVRPRRP
jgi:hypothetical protein